MKKQVYQRWTWVFIYLLFNEVFEELCMAVTGINNIKHTAVKPQGAVAGSCGWAARECGTDLAGRLCVAGACGRMRRAATYLPGARNEALHLDSCDSCHTVACLALKLSHPLPCPQTLTVAASGSLTGTCGSAFDAAYDLEARYDSTLVD